jgi:hypothetical protein
LGRWRSLGAMKQRPGRRREDCGRNREPSHSPRGFYHAFLVALAFGLSACASTQTGTADYRPGQSQFELEINDGSRPWNNTDWVLWMNRFGGGR